MGSLMRNVFNSILKPTVSQRMNNYVYTCIIILIIRAFARYLLAIDTLIPASCAPLYGSLSLTDVITTSSCFEDNQTRITSCSNSGSVSVLSFTLIVLHVTNKLHDNAMLYAIITVGNQINGFKTFASQASCPSMDVHPSRKTFTII